MGLEGLTDEKIAALLDLPKRLTGWDRKAPKQKAGHAEQQASVQGEDGSSFFVFIRRNVLLSDDFSCGLVWRAPGGSPVTLARFNGSSHSHLNKLEGNRIARRCHIHMITRRYIDAGLDPDGFAVETDAYTGLRGALRALAERCKIEGLVSNQTELEL